VLMNTRPIYCLVVKSVSSSLGLKLPSAAFSQVHASAGRTPQAQAFSGDWFSVVARSQVHWPAGRARHEQRGPWTAFSAPAFSHVQWRADCLPHEHVACLAQTHSALLPQQVDAFETWVAMIFVWTEYLVEVASRLGWGSRTEEWIEFVGYR